MDAGRVRGSRWYHIVVGVGLVSYGVVHLVIAWIATKIAVGRGGDASSEGALRELAGQPLGAVLVWVMAAGLFGLVVWQVLVAIVGRGESGQPGSLRRRLVSVGRAIVYLALGVLAVRVALGGGGSSGRAEDAASARLMQLPAGQILVAALGAGVLAVGIGQIVKGVRRRFDEDLDTSAGTVITGLAVVGYLAKGVALVIIAGLFGLAALRYDPGQAGGLDEALTTVRDQPFGPVLLMIIAAGIAAFGVYCFFWAKHAKY
jgi:hypothetical protein